MILRICAELASVGKTRRGGRGQVEVLASLDGCAVLGDQYAGDRKPRDPAKACVVVGTASPKA